MDSSCLAERRPPAHNDRLIAEHPRGTRMTATFDFDTVLERRGTGSVKWDIYGPDVLPLWVADMDFLSPKPILRALKDRVEHGIFGYAFDDPALRQVLVERMARLYNWTIEAKDILFLPNLVSALAATSRAFAAEGEGVLMNTPVYPPFLASPQTCDRQQIVAPLALTTQGQIMRYELDMDALEAALTPTTRIFMLCNPHNPVGRAYTRAELETIAEFCLRHNLLIVSDDIHCDLLLDDVQHIPIASLSPEVAAQTITLMAPSKTFNIPSLGLGFVIAQDAAVRARFEKATAYVVPHPGPMGFVAALAAYTECQPWLDALLPYLRGNRDYLVDYVQQHFPQVMVTRPEATYLSWMDFRALNLPDSPFKFCLERARVAFNDGALFGEAGAGFLRVNLGCPRSTLHEALERVREAVNSGVGAD
jgi:cystathionine beta-lyase